MTKSNLMYSLALALLLFSVKANADTVDCTLGSGGGPCWSAYQHGNGDGAQGYAAGSGAGIVGGTTTGKGVYAYASSGFGVWAMTTDTTYGVAVYGQTPSPNPAVYGYGSSTTQNSIGVKGHANSSGTAIWGYNSGGANYMAGWFDGVVYSNGSQLTSDARLKKDVRDLSYGVADVLKMRPVTFKWKAGGDATRVGLIAQEVQKIFPELVSSVKSPAGQEVLAVDYMGLVPVLIKGAQEQNKIIAKQEARIAALEQGRSPLNLSSMFGGGAALGLLPLGLVLASRRRSRSSAAGSQSE